jgi:ADP-ribose pyrophosphatase YjhB (NUDIX family)
MAQTERFPRVVVTGVVFDTSDRILLLRSDHWSGHYIIPGGKVRYGETILDALRREIREETGLEIDDIVFLFVAEGIELAEAHHKKHSIYLVHRCRTPGGEVRLNHEAQDFTWVGLQEALSRPLNTTSRATIERLQSMPQQSESRP